LTSAHLGSKGTCAAGAVDSNVHWVKTSFTALARALKIATHANAPAKIRNV